MKTIISTFVLLCSLNAFSAETNLGKHFKDGTIRKIDSTPANYDFSKNKRNIFYVWASWCPHCKEHAPKFIEQYEKLKDCEKIGFATINQDRSLHDGKKAARDWNMPDIPMFCDEDGAVRANYSGGIPKILIFDEKGDLLETKVGGSAIHYALEDILKGAKYAGDCR